MRYLSWVKSQEHLCKWNQLGINEDLHLGWMSHTFGITRGRNCFLNSCDCNKIGIHNSHVKIHLPSTNLLISTAHESWATCSPSQSTVSSELLGTVWMWVSWSWCCLCERSCRAVRSQQSHGGWWTHRRSLVVCPLRRCSVLFSNSYILIKTAFEKKH